MATAPSPSSPLDQVARILSVLTHPIWIPFGFYLLASPPGFAYTSFYEPLLSLGILVLAPLITTLLYFRKHQIRDFYVVDKKHRTLPFVFNIVALLGFSFFIPPQAIALGYELMLLPWMGSFIIANIVALIITLNWKISLHLMGLGLTAGWLSSYLWDTPAFWPVMAGLVVLVVAVGWARKRLQSHDLAQLVIGFATGIAIVAAISLVVSQIAG